MGLVITVLLLAILWLVCGFLGAWTGSGKGRIWRRVVLPGITTVIGIIGLWDFRGIFLMARAGVLSLGYGIPDPPSYPEPRDPGSKIGAFWWKVFTRKKIYEVESTLKKTGIATRGTVGFLEGLSILAVPFIKGGAGVFSLWLWAVLGLCVSNILFGELIKKEGTINVFGKDLLWEEVYIHGTDSVIIIILILLCR